MPTNKKITKEKCNAIRRYGGANATIGSVHYCNLKKGHKGKHYAPIMKEHL